MGYITCIYCGAKIDQWGSGRLYCTDACRQRAYRHRNKQGGHKVVTKACTNCFKNYQAIGRSKYCSDACKQAAYRRRNKIGKQTSF